MNELLQKLETRAWAFADSEFDWENPQVTREQLFKKHFAELIVTKCAVIATRCESNDTKNIGFEILDQFGVE